MLALTTSPVYEEEAFPEGFVNGQVGYEPGNIRQAQAHATWPLWKAAMDKEVKGLLSRGTWVEDHGITVHFQRQIHWSKSKTGSAWGSTIS
jgi:hypothetical protein